MKLPVVHRISLLGWATGSLLMLTSIGCGPSSKPSSALPTTDSQPDSSLSSHSDESGPAGSTATADGHAGSSSGAGTGSSLAGADLLLITIDTLRADALGFAGNSRVSTPYLDRLAREGRVFPFAHAHNVVTLPSHTNILTGLYPYQHGIRDNTGFQLEDGIPTLATLTKAAGYQTAAFVSAYPLDRLFGLDRGFDIYDDHFAKGSSQLGLRMDQRAGVDTVGRAINWWRQHEGKSRFLWLHVFDPHAPYEAPEPFASRYPEDPYLAEVAATDDALGKLLQMVFPCAKAGSCARPLVVAVTADHGESLGEHGEETHGLFAYEATLRVPLILWASGLEPARDERLARHIDLLPTLLSAVGLEAPAAALGSNLLDRASEAPVESYFESLSTSINRGWAPLRGWMKDRQKAIRLPLAELYDLRADPQEVSNLVNSERRTYRELIASIPEAAYARSERSAISSEQEARLRSLGYFAGATTGEERTSIEDDPKNLIDLDRQAQKMAELYAEGDYFEVVKIGRSLANQRPDFGLAYSLAAQALLELGRLPDAIQAMEEARRNNAASPSLLLQLGLSLAQAGAPDRAIELLEPLTKSVAPADRPVAWNALATAYAGRGETARARDAVAQGMTLDDDDPRLWQTRGMLDLQSGKLVEAERSLNRAIELNGSLPEAWNMLGVLRYQQGKGPAVAIEAWQRSLALQPRQPDVWFNLGLVARDSGRKDLARQAMERFVELATPPNLYAADLERARALLAELK